MKFFCPVLGQVFGPRKEGKKTERNRLRFLWQCGKLRHLKRHEISLLASELGRLALGKKKTMSPAAIAQRKAAAIASADARRLPMPKARRSGHAPTPAPPARPTSTKTTSTKKRNS